MVAKDIETVDLQTSATPQQPPSLDDSFNVGYMVGLNNEGQFVFQVFGAKKGLIELMGINNYANEQVKKVFSEYQGTGDKLVVEVGRLVSNLNQKFDNLVKVLLPPTNKL